jgi:hypothetical protein
MQSSGKISMKQPRRLFRLVDALGSVNSTKRLCARSWLQPKLHPKIRPSCSRSKGRSLQRRKPSLHLKASRRRRHRSFRRLLLHQSYLTSPGGESCHVSSATFSIRRARVPLCVRTANSAYTRGVMVSQPKLCQQSGYATSALTIGRRQCQLSTCAHCARSKRRLLRCLKRLESPTRRSQTASVKRRDWRRSLWTMSSWNTTRSRPVLTDPATPESH